MTTKLEALETWAAGLLEQLQPGARNQLARSIGQELRRSQQNRVLMQQNPDGSKFVPRKKRDLRRKKGRIRRKLEMFQKLHKVAYLKAKGDGSAISVGFTGRVARIARVHQYGLRDRAATDAPPIRYEQREILGFTDADIEMIRDRLLEYLAP